MELPTWVNAPPRLAGRQQPADESAFDGDETDGDRAAELGARLGVRPFPWQWMALRKILSHRADGLWTHPDCLLVATRQSGKSLIIILRILFGLFVLNERIVYSAQRWVTAESVYRRLKAIIEARPSLQRRLAKDPTSSSSRAVIELRSGAIVALGVRSGDLGRGLDSIDLVVFDEAYNHTEEEVSALTGAQLASPNSQTIYTSTPPVWEKHPNCQVLADMRRLGQQRQADLYFAEWGAPKDMARDDPETWRVASPSYGVIQKERDVRRMLAKATTPAARALFDADVLGWGEWPPDESELGAVISAQVWATMTNPAPELVGPIALAVDRSPDRQVWAIAAAQRTTDGRIHIEIGPYDPASNADLVDKLVHIVTEWDPIALAIDQRSAAAVLTPYLIEAEIEPHVTNASELAQSCGGFLDDAMAGRLSHSDQEILNDAVVAAVKRDLPGGGFAWAKTAGSSIAQLMAATLAHWSLLTFGTAARPKPPPPLSDTRPGRYDDCFLDLDRVPF
jgi:hypothetical protein